MWDLYSLENGVMSLEDSAKSLACFEAERLEIGDDIVILSKYLPLSGETEVILALNRPEKKNPIAHMLEMSRSGKLSKALTEFGMDKIPFDDETKRKLFLAPEKE